MKTATVRELRNRYRDVLRWVEAGEEVAISKRGVIMARLVPVNSKTQRVDWAESAAAKMDRRQLPRLTAKQIAALLAESQSHG